MPYALIIMLGSLSSLEGSPRTEDLKGGAAVQLYIFTQDYSSRGKKMEDSLDEVFAAAKGAGFDDIQGWLSFYGSPEAAKRTAGLLSKHKLTMQAAYTGGAMHVDEKAAAAIKSIVDQARVGAANGLKVVIMNPDTVGREKTDEELAIQSRNLNLLGGRLRELGLRLAIHTHDPEMRSNAREWYHILKNTEADKVFFCLDLHWIFRGKQDPYKLLEDAGKRAIDLHLRNSKGGVWSEDLGDGDIDHQKVAGILEKIGYKGLYTVELAYEGGTKPTRPLEENLARSRAYLRKMFGK